MQHSHVNPGHYTAQKIRFFNFVGIFTFQYILPEGPKKKEKGKDRDSKKTKTDDFAAFTEAVRDVKVSWLTKLNPTTKEYEVGRRMQA